MQKRLIITYIIITLIGVSITGIFSIKAIENYYVKNVEDKLISNARMARDLIQQIGEDRFGRRYLEEVTSRLAVDSGARVTIIDKTGIVLSDSAKDAETMDNHKNRPEIVEALQGRIGKSTRYSKSINTNMMYIALPLYRDSGIEAVVRLSLPLGEIKRIIKGIWTVVFLAILLGTLTTFFIGIKFSKEIIRPIREMTIAVKDIAMGNYSRRIKIKTKDELKELSEAFNYMAERLNNTLQELTDKKKEIEAILTSMVDGVIAVSIDGRIILTNPSAEAMFRVEKDNIMGRHFLEIIRNYELYEFLQEVLNSGEVSFKELRILSPKERILRVHITPLKDGDKMMGAVAVMRDITEIRRLERVRRDFVANVSHELKTPLTSIKGFVETLLSGAKNDEKVSRRFLEIIDFEATRLSNMIEDLLNLSEIENSQENFKKEKVDLKEIIERLSIIFKNRLTAKNLSLDINIQDELPPLIGDRLWAEQVMINLVDNAVKYTPDSGKIRVSAKEAGDYIIVEVEDTGIGIPEEDIPRLFERFYRVDKARSRVMGGTGLGLAIVKHAVKAMDGEVSVKSQVGKGSTFTVKFKK